MKPIRPVLHEGAMLRTFGVNQPDLYYALPASVDADGTVMTEWQLSAEDLACLLNGGRLRLWLSSVDLSKPLTPIELETVE